MIDQILRTGDSRGTQFQIMVRDQYANYVVQMVIECANEEQLQIIVQDLQANISQIRHYTYGKHILARVERATGIKM